jgi:hypothetical protein
MVTGEQAHVFSNTPQSFLATAQRTPHPIDYWLPIFILHEIKADATALYFRSPLILVPPMDHPNVKKSLSTATFTPEGFSLRYREFDI